MPLKSIFLIVFMSVCVSVAAQNKTADSAVSPAIAELVTQLGNKSFTTRDKATAALIKLGMEVDAKLLFPYRNAVISKLKPLQQSTDPEVAARARKIVSKLTEFVFARDDQGRPISRTDSKGLTVEWAYDDDGHIVEVVDPSGNKMLYYYEGEKLTKCKLPDEQMVYFHYSNSGKIWKIVSPSGTMHFVYDDKDKLVKKVMPDGSEVKNPELPDTPALFLKKCLMGISKTKWWMGSN